MFARDRKTPIAEWWWTIDNQLLSALVLLMAVGMVLSFAASPPVAERLGLSPWHFIIRHAMFDLLALPVLIGTSFLSHRQARFAALGIPAVNYGPGDPLLAHMDDESAPLAQYRDAEAAMRRWLETPAS